MDQKLRLCTKTTSAVSCSRPPSLHQVPIHPLWIIFISFWCFFLYFFFVKVNVYTYVSFQILPSLFPYTRQWKLLPSSYLPFVFISEVSLEHSHILSFLKFTSLIHVEFILVYGRRCGSSFIFF